MTLYKNVDVKDLYSIFKRGVISLNESGNNNWDNGKRADNSKDFVYLFNPLTEQTTFVNYGAALLKIDIDEKEVTEQKLMETDVNYGKYTEYVCKRISPEQIIAVYIPLLFKDKIVLSKLVEEKTVWCKMKADVYRERKYIPCGYEDMNQIIKTAQIVDSCEDRYFRGIDENKNVIDIYNINYEIN